MTHNDHKIPWLIDFGISAQIHSTVSQTLSERSGSGTPGYMAPEQCLSQQQDGRTDQYALAVVVYQLLSGHLPFEASNPVALCGQIVNVPAPPLTNVPASVNDVIQRALSKNRKYRFSSCEEFLDALIGKKPAMPFFQRAARPITEGLKKIPLPLLVFCLALLVMGLYIFRTSEERTETAKQNEIAKPIEISSPTQQETSLAEPKSDSSEMSVPTADEADFEMNGSFLKKYKGHAEKLVIPAVINGQKVTKIGESAFRGCSSLTSVVIPKGVTEIGNYTFAGCSSLTSVVIPDSIKEIGEGAFSDCTALKEWSISSNHPYFKTDGTGLLTKDGKTLVACLASATEYQIPEGVTVIGGYVFSGCSSITSVVIPDSVERIGSGAFAGCTALKEWTISSTHPYFKREGGGLLTKDGKSLVAFLGSAKEYRIPKGVTEIRNWAFSGCSSLTSVVIP